MFTKGQLNTPVLGCIADLVLLMMRVYSPALVVARIQNCLRHFAAGRFDHFRIARVVRQATEDLVVCPAIGGNGLFELVGFFGLAGRSQCFDAYRSQARRHDRLRRECIS